MVHTSIQQTFINIPVADLKKTVTFFTKLGFAFDKQFTDKNAACLIIGKNQYAMLITKKFFSSFTKKPISDAKKTTEVLIALQVKTRREVDTLMKKAVAAGARTYNDKYDHGWMYGHAFADLDGHQWEVFWMDQKKRPKQKD